MTTSKNQQAREPQAYKQQADEAGRIRLDRPFTDAEAQAQDHEHAQRYLENRALRFPRAR